MTQVKLPGSRRQWTLLSRPFITQDSDTEQLRTFYSRLGFKVLAEGQPLPPLLGKQWVPPHAELPVFFFYKLLAKQ